MNDVHAHIALAYAGLLQMLDARGFSMNHEDETWLGLYDNVTRRAEKAAWIAEQCLQAQRTSSAVLDKTFVRTCTYIPHWESVDVNIVTREEIDAFGVAHTIAVPKPVRTPAAQSLGIPLEFAYTEHLHVLFMLFAKEDDEKYKACQMEILTRHQHFLTGVAEAAEASDWRMLPSDFHRVLLVTDTEKYRKEIREFGRTHGYETWTTSELILDASRHVLNSAFPAILAPDSATLLMLATSFVDPATGERHPFPQSLTSLSQLPSRTTDDPVVRYLGGCHGDVMFVLDYLRIGTASPHLDAAEWFIVRDRDHFALAHLHPKRVVETWIAARLSMPVQRKPRKLKLPPSRQANLEADVASEHGDDDDDQEREDGDYDMTAGSSSLLHGGSAARLGDDDDEPASVPVRHRETRGAGDNSDDDEDGHSTSSSSSSSSDGGSDDSNGEYDQCSDGGEDD